jgi:hypothetical protein
MRDLPSGSALLALARDMLVNELMPLLPRECRPDALLVAKCMAIAEREAEAPAEEERAIFREIELFCGQGMDALRRFAYDLRIGAFESSEPRDRAARAILWRLAIASLRQSNPEFLAANGFDQPGGVVGRAKPCPSPVSGKPSTPSPEAKSSSSPTTTTARTKAT